MLNFLSMASSCVTDRSRPSLPSSFSPAKDKPNRLQVVVSPGPFSTTTFSQEQPSCSLVPGASATQDQLERRETRSTNPSSKGRGFFNHSYKTNTNMSTFNSNLFSFSFQGSSMIGKRLKEQEESNNACYQSAQRPLRLPPATATAGAKAYKARRAGELTEETERSGE